MNKQQFESITKWQKETFGQATSLSKLAHLEKELVELISDLESGAPDRRLEFADCFFLLFGAAAADGMTYEDIEKAIDEKFAINKARKWGQPDANGVVEHIDFTASRWQQCQSSPEALGEETFGRPATGSIYKPQPVHAPTIGGDWLKKYLEDRIAYLKKTDAEVCQERWDMTQPPFKRLAARDTSNFLVERRHELEELLKVIPAYESPAPFPTMEQAEQWVIKRYGYDYPDYEYNAALAMYDWIAEQLVKNSPPQ